MNTLAIVRLVLLVVATTTKVTSKIPTRNKRYLVYPAPGSKVQVIVGTGVPIPLEKHAVTMGWVLKAKYFLPTNSSEYTDSYVTFQKRSVATTTSRYDLYRAFEIAASRFGAGGKECTLRSICDASRIPLRGSGLLGRIFRILLLYVTDPWAAAAWGGLRQQMRRPCCALTRITKRQKNWVPRVPIARLFTLRVLLLWLICSRF